MKKLIVVFLLISTILAGCKSTQKSVIVQQPSAPLKSMEMQETYWKLIELMGKPVVFSENNSKEIYIVLNKNGNSVHGFSGCNSIMGKYELKEGNRITFSAMASTMMACPDMAIESEFNKMLGTVDNYSIQNNMMTLNKAKMAPMARFEAVVPE